MKISLNFTHLHEKLPVQKLFEVSRNFLKESILQMFGYTCLDAGLNISWFPGVIASSKPMRHLTFNGRNPGETIEKLKKIS